MRIIIEFLSENLSLLLFLSSISFTLTNILRKSLSEEIQEIIETFFEESKAFNKIIVSINSSMYKVIYELLKSINENKNNDSENKKEIEYIIVNLLVNKKAKKESYSYLVLFTTLILYISIMFILSLTIKKVIIFILLGLILALYVKQKILEYRIKNGYYGTNQSEAREIISFILDNSDDFNNFNGYDKVFPKIEKQEILKGINDLTGAEVYE